MKFFLASLGMQLRRLLRQAAILACLLCLPALTLLLGLTTQPGSAQNILQVGIFIPEGSAKGDLIWNRLSEYSDEEILFIRADSEAQLEDMVAARAWECGYVFVQNLDEKLEQGDYRRIITRVMSPASMPLFTGWTLTSVVMEVCTPNIVIHYLEDTGFLDADASRELPAYESGLYGPDHIMELEVEQVFGGGQGGQSSASLTGATLVRGSIALLLFLISCLCAVRHLDDLSSGFFRRLAPYVHPLRLYLSSWLAAGILSFAAGLAALAAARQLFPAQFASLAAEAGLLLIYLVFLAGASFLLACLFRHRESLIALLPFLLIACLLFCPILFDIGQWIAPAKIPALLLPPTLYLRAGAGRPEALWQMLLAGALCFAAGLGLSRLRGARGVA